MADQNRILFPVLNREQRDRAQDQVARDAALAQVYGQNLVGLICSYEETVLDLEERLKPALEACQAAADYDAAIEKCGNDPSKMASFCTAEGDTLDTLYARWQSLAKKVIADNKPKETPCLPQKS